MPFLHDVWYAVGFPHELDSGKALARTIADIPLLIFKDREAVIALRDECPHRFAPLSLGTIADGAVTCRYHGLKFAADGKCIFNPHGAMTSSLAVKSFAAVARHDILWVWL